jgi:hypothetical protein
MQKEKRRKKIKKQEAEGRKQKKTERELNH